MKRINLTQHTSTPAQGCAPRSEEEAREIKELLTFDELPILAEIARRATALAEIAVDAGTNEAMVGGAGYLILALDPALRMRGIQPVHAFSARESVEETQADGSVRKVARFRHLGFVRF